MNNLTTNSSTGGLPSFSRAWTGSSDDPEMVHDFEIKRCSTG